MRLARGPRFWRSARCPICRGSVDPTRLRRIAAWARERLAPRSSSITDRLLAWSGWGYLLGIVILVVLLQGFGDRWWPATTLLFGPRWVVLPPGVVLAGVALIRDRRLLWPIGLGLLLAVGPLVEFRTGWRTAFLPDPGPQDLQVVTYNVAGGDGLTHSAERMMERWGADLILFQECGGPFRDALLASADAGGRWSDSESTLCILSRHPILSSVAMDASSLQVAGGSGRVVTWVLQVGDTQVAATNVHLETPRDAFELLRSGQIGRAIPVMTDKSRLREIELRRSRQWVDSLDPGPRIVAGDFNTPPESRLYHEHWGDWTNAWGRTGRGFGGTRLNGWIRPRIDHIVVDEGWTVLEAEVGEDLGSDHLPVRAALRLLQR